uniref:Alpha beta-propellor repeat-containing integrin n=1 Tax=Tetraselmis sp. GSL018 TaxID=582737 RepID=A0A061RIT7_9CHLO
MTSKNWRALLLVFLVSFWALRVTGFTTFSQITNQFTGTETSERFGAAVGIHGSIAAVGAPNAGPGTVYFFEEQVSGDWLQLATLSPSDGSAGDEFGVSLSLVGGTALAVGAQGYGSGSGAVYVFGGSGSSWALRSTILSTEASAAAQFGSAVALNAANLLAIGAPESGRDGPQTSGHVYVFQLGEDLSTYSEVFSIGSPEPRQFGFFGMALAISSDRLFISELISENVGQVRIYSLSAASATLESTLQIAEETSFELFGSSIALSGEVLAVGAQLKDVSGVLNAGAVYSYRYSGEAWVEETEVVMGSPAEQAQFGTSVALEDDRLVVGAPGMQGSGSSYLVLLPIYPPSPPLPPPPSPPLPPPSPPTPPAPLAPPGLYVDDRTCASGIGADGTGTCVVTFEALNPINLHSLTVEITLGGFSPNSEEGITELLVNGNDLGACLFEVTGQPTLHTCLDTVEVEGLIADGLLVVELKHNVYLGLNAVVALRAELSSSSDAAGWWWSS